MLQWISCNVYTVTRITIMKKLETVLKTYDLKKYPAKKRGALRFTQN